MTQKTTFTIDNYGKKSTFASFLPGISGIHGIPIWCYYVNRGQGVVSFGVDNKDHAIMEFYPAHQAYQNVKTTGFRTFIKKEGKIYEPFSKEQIPHSMHISMNGLDIEETNTENGLKTKVSYFSLPGERVGALVRKVTIENLAEETVELEILDGMPALIPYGVELESMKNMGQTAKAWMQAEDVESGMPYFRVRASMADTATVSAILGGNFSYGCLEDGTLLKPLVDPTVVFSYDTSLRSAAGFEEKTIEQLYNATQATKNQLPCNFYGIKRSLTAGEAVTMYEVIGQVENKDVLQKFLDKKIDGKYFAAKKREADSYVEEICKGISTKTASKDFDAYCQYTYMDNVLRGGYPIRLGSNKIFYVYSRKHGDLERDYNYFSMLPEFYSQGNGNFRDVNQNRRCDVFFAPFVGRENIKEFYSLIQLDGYNPLGIEKLTYQLEPAIAEEILSVEKDSGRINEEVLEEIKDFVNKPFTPGALYKKLDACMAEEDVEALFLRLIDFAKGLVNGNFGEGYWSDHWTYNLDLIADYLEVFPEKEEEMLFEKDYSCFLSQINIQPRKKRYAKTPNGLRQYHFLDEKGKRHTEEKLVRMDFGKGEPYKMTLLAKLVLLCAAKFAALDAYGMGIEMEGGKPGWYDALNGMPGMFGSSMAETYELCRMLEYTLDVLKKYPGEVELLKELAEFLRVLDTMNKKERKVIHAWEDMDCTAEMITAQGELLSFWNDINDAKEAYRVKVFDGISGAEDILTTEEITDIFEGFLSTVKCGIRKACILGNGISPTYFTYEVPEYKEVEEGIEPLRFVVKPVPAFLEGPVRYLKLQDTKENKQALYDRVKNSDLYDEKLHMYKVNASLEEASYELGRARAFTPGWLENESIWLHMEYKYLLELLRNGMYEEFFADFHQAAVPFLDPKVYGRSIYENSSFIASSKNPDASIHGKGFVARLSGSTVEFISMWKWMLFGESVFSLQEGKLCFTPQPALPKYLIPADGKVCAVMLGNVAVTYQFDEVKDYIPGNYRISQMRFVYKNKRVVNVNGGCAEENIARNLRDGEILSVEIFVGIKK